MLFTSLEFILFFLPTVVVGYYLLPVRWGLRNLWLLLISLFFYAWGEPWFVFVMLASIVANWLMALFVHGRPAVLWVAIAANLALLFVYKYLNFATGGVTHFVLPIGISFTGTQSANQFLLCRSRL